MDMQRLMSHLSSSGNTQWVLYVKAGGISRKGAVAILLEQAKAAVDQVAQGVCQVGIDNVPEALLLEVSILHSQLQLTELCADC